METMLRRLSCAQNQQSTQTRNPKPRLNKIPQYSNSRELGRGGGHGDHERSVWEGGRKVICSGTGSIGETTGVRWVVGL